MKNRMEFIVEQQAEITIKLDRLAEAQAKTELKVENLTKNVEVLTENVEALTENVEALTENVEALAENVVSLTENVNKVTFFIERVGTFSEKVAELAMLTEKRVTMLEDERRENRSN